MSKFEVINTSDVSDNTVLHITQRNLRGGAIGDVVALNPGETAEVDIESQGVQLTIEVSPKDGIMDTPVEPVEE